MQNKCVISCLWEIILPQVLVLFFILSFFPELHCKAPFCCISLAAFHQVNCPGSHPMFWGRKCFQLQKDPRSPKGTQHLIVTFLPPQARTSVFTCPKSRLVQNTKLTHKFLQIFQSCGKKGVVPAARFSSLWTSNANDDEDQQKVLFALIFLES